MSTAALRRLANEVLLDCSGAPLDLETVSRLQSDCRETLLDGLHNVRKQENALARAHRGEVLRGMGLA